MCHLPRAMPHHVALRDKPRFAAAYNPYVRGRNISIPAPDEVTLAVRSDLSVIMLQLIGQW